MPIYYDIHNHIFNKNVVIRTLANVVQALLLIADEKEAKISKLKLKSIIKTLNIVTQQTSKDVFNTLDQTCGGEMVITPLMLDLTYTDDNDGNKGQNRRYRLRIELLFKIVRKLLSKLERVVFDQEVKNHLDQLQEELKILDKKFKVSGDGELELFNNANYKEQIEELEKLASENSRVRPFFSVDPRKKYKDGIDIIAVMKEKVAGVNAKFIGVKLYAPLGFSPTDPLLMDRNNGLYQFCSTNKIPITVHCSDSGFSCFSTQLIIRGDINEDGKIKHYQLKKHKFRKKFATLGVGKAIHERATVLNHPKLWEMVLQAYPLLKLNLAHFGGSTSLMEYVEGKLPKTISMDYNKFVASFPNSLEAYKRAKLMDCFRVVDDQVKLKREFAGEPHRELWDIFYEVGLIDNWAKAIHDLIANSNYPNVYTDLSSFSAGKETNDPNNPGKQIYTIKNKLSKFKSTFYDTLNDYEKSKILYGSDFFLINFFGPEMKRYYEEFKEVFDDEFDDIASKNPEQFLSRQ